MTGRLTKKIVCLLLLTMVGARLYAEEPAEKKERPPRMRKAMSASGRFIVTGTDAIRNQTWAMELEDLIGRMESWAGLKIPFRPSESIVVKLLDKGKPGVLPRQQFTSIGLRQELIVQKPAEVPFEDRLFAAGRLLINRWVMPRCPAGVRPEQVGETPDWLVYAVCGNVYRPLQQRNRELLLEDWRKGTLASPAKAFNNGSWVLPPVFLEWIRSETDNWPKALDQLMRFAARDEAVTADVLGSVSDKGPSFEPVWDLWVAKRSNVRAKLGVSTPRDIRQMHQACTITGAEASAFSLKNQPEGLALEALPNLLDRPWLPYLLQYKIGELSRLAIGAAPQEAATLNAYINYFAALQQQIGRLPKEKQRAELLVKLRKAEALCLSVE